MFRYQSMKGEWVYRYVFPPFLSRATTLVTSCLLFLDDKALLNWCVLLTRVGTRNQGRVVQN